MKDLVVLKQLPVLEEQIKVLAVDIQGKIDNALSLECTEESKTKVKKVRAELSKTKKEYEDKRIEVKNKILKPYNDFEVLFKKYIGDPLGSADTKLKSKIDEIEITQKNDLEKIAKEYFEEYKQAKNTDFVTFGQTGIKVTLSTNPTALKRQVAEFIDRVASDLALIDTQEHKTEIMVEYKKHLNVSQAITAVSERHKAIEIEQSKIMAAEKVKVAEEKVIEKVENFTAPIVEEQELTLRFSVTATKDKLRALKQFLNDGGYKYE